MSQQRAIPGPRSIPPLDPFLSQLRLARDPLGRMTQLFTRYGSLVALLRGGGGRVFSSDPGCPGVVFARGAQLLREAELDHEAFHRSALTGQLTPTPPVAERKRPILEWGTGLFAVNGDEHRRHRKIISPFFTKSRVEQHLGEMLDATQNEVSRWQPGQTIDVHRAMMNVTVRIAARTLLGLDLTADEDVVRAGATSLRLVLSPGALLAPWDLPGFPYRRFVDSVGFFNKRMRELIDQRRREQSRRADVLSELIAARDEGRALSDSELIGHASIIYAASHETTGNALTWTLFLLSQHPGWYQAVTEEVRSIQRSGLPTTHELDRLNLLADVIKESLRILPSAPWTTRVAGRDAMLGGYFIPKGTEVVLSIFHTHRVEKCYEDPDVFDLGRWRRIDLSVFEFNAFSAGPRACIGSGFAMLEMKAILAMVLNRYRLELDSRLPVDPVLNVTMAPRAGLRMTVRDDTDFDLGKASHVRGSITRLVRLSPSE